MSRPRILITLLVLSISLQASLEALAQFGDQAKWVPEHANCIILINADQIFSSQISTRENWASAGSGAFERGLSIVPPNVGRVMLASQIDFHYVEPIWTIGVFTEMTTKMSLTDLVAGSDKQIEKLGERDALELREDVFLVQLDSSTFGMMTPANRQSTVRWLQDGDSGRVRLTQYLSDAMSFADKNADLIIAFDLEHVLSVNEARSRLLNLDGVRATVIDELAQAASKLTGATLGVTVRDGITGSLRIDFQPGTEGLKRISKSLIHEILSNNGIMIDDCLNWELSEGDSRVVFSGPLSTTGLRKISSLINQPIRAEFSGVSTQASQEPVSIGKSTRAYLDSIDVYFREADEFIQGPRYSNSKAYARWFDKYANKVDSLPSRNVDPQVLEFGAEVADGFRTVSITLASAEADASSRVATEVENRDTGNYGYGYYGYGYGYGYRHRTMSSYKKAVRTQEYGQAAVEAKGTMRNLRDGLGELRRQMSSKYSDF